MGHEILHAHTFAFFWGQGYGGVEPYVVSAVSAVAGQSPFTLNLTPSLLALAASVLVWRVGLRVFRDMAAISAAVLCWIWSESSLWNSTRETGYHQVCVVLSLLVLLQSLRIVCGVRRRRREHLANWLVLGLSIGVGFWASPEIVYIALPAGVAALFTLRYHSLSGALSRLAAVIAMSALGSLPWLWATLGGRGSWPPASPVSYASRLGTFFSHVLPMLLGLRTEGAGDWEGGPAVGAIIYVALACLIVVAMALVTIRTRDGWIVAATLVLFPFLYTAFPTAWFWNDGRYALVLSPILSLVVVGGVFQLVRAPSARWATSIILMIAFASTLIAVNSSLGIVKNPSQLTRWNANPNPSVTSLAAKLEQIGVTHAYTGYGVANDLTFISGNRVRTFSIGESRNPTDADTVQTAKSAAWVFVTSAVSAKEEAQLGSSTDVNPDTVTSMQLTGWLNSHGIPYRVYHSGFFEIIAPVRNITPADLTS